jgi:hypothetical protein
MSALPVHDRAVPRALLIALGLIAVVPLATGLLGIIGGLEFGPGDGEAVAYFDSEYRFLNVVWFAVGIALLWTLRAPIERAPFTRFILASLVCGGLSRLISVSQVGWPPGVFRGSLVVELIVIPVLLIWHVLSVRSAPTPSSRASA